MIRMLYEGGKARKISFGKILVFRYRVQPSSNTTHAFLRAFETVKFHSKEC